MIRDYHAGYYTGRQSSAMAVSANRWRLGIGRTIATGLGSIDVLGRTICLMVATTLVLGVASTFWVGRQIDRTLAEIGASQKLLGELHESNGEILSLRDSMLSREQMVQQAEALGLYPPTEDQIRKM